MDAIIFYSIYYCNPMLPPPHPLPSLDSLCTLKPHILTTPAPDQNSLDSGAVSRNKTALVCNFKSTTKWSYIEFISRVVLLWGSTVFECIRCDYLPIPVPIPMVVPMLLPVPVIPWVVIIPAAVVPIWTVVVVMATMMIMTFLGTKKGTCCL